MNTIDAVRAAMACPDSDQAAIDNALRALLVRARAITAEAIRALRDQSDLRPACARYLRDTAELHGRPVREMIEILVREDDALLPELAWGLSL